MPRNMSFSLTTEQVRSRTKTVTRRRGWNFLIPGDVVNACVKCRGLKKGQKVEHICQIRILNVRKEVLSDLLQEPYPIYGREEIAREGFPGMTILSFIYMFCGAQKCDRDEVLTRIEFEYIEP